MSVFSVTAGSVKGDRRPAALKRGVKGGVDSSVGRRDGQSNLTGEHHGRCSGNRSRCGGAPPGNRQYFEINWDAARLRASVLARTDPVDLGIAGCGQGCIRV